jgi:ABC-type uncharacterized transport system ATPase subunit/ABC-type uncharacterized transport system permease subunit
VSIPRLQLAHITKRYPSVVANSDVSLTVQAGETHAVLGENGAGKSTLMKIIYGAVKPDEGSVMFDGQPVHIRNPQEARALGISMVFQHFSLFDTLTVAENVWLGLDKSLTLHQVTHSITAKAREYGLEVDPARPGAHALGGRDAAGGDHPRAAHQPQAADPRRADLGADAAGGGEAVRGAQAARLRGLQHPLHLAQAARDPRAVHRLHRDARGQGHRRRGPAARDQCDAVAPDDRAEPPELEHHERQPGEVVLKVQGLTLPREDQFGHDLDDVSFEVRAGEVVGIAGVSGNGQRELLFALSGEDRRAGREMIQVAGQNAGRLGPSQRRQLGLHFVPEERLGRGAVPGLSLAQNLLLTRSDSLKGSGWIDVKALRRQAAGIIQRFNVKAGGPGAAAKSLSGGNLQKFIVGREIDANPKLLIVSQPTWGVDVGASAQIRAEILALRDAGCAVLVLSEELEELFEISDRLHVIAKGRLSPSVERARATVTQIGEWMSGLWVVHPLRETRPVPSPRPSPRERGRKAAMFKLEPRPEASRFWSLASPVLALVVTVLLGTLLFVALGKDPVRGLQVFFWEPVNSGYRLGELMVKATPLLIIALGLAVCFRSNVWNIGAEGQFVLGAVVAGGVALLAGKETSRFIVVAILLAGVLGGMAWAAITGVLRDRFNANEILVSLMLVYVATLTLNYLVFGPWKDPQGYNFPQTKTFEAVTQVPRLMQGSRVNIGVLLALAGVAALWVFLFRTRAGFAQQVGGLAPAAARYAGFSSRKALWTALLVSGGAAGLAGALEVAGPIGQLTPYVPAGYGFAAIIVAFVGRLHPVGMVFSALLMSMFYIGGELAQSRLGLPKSLTGVFQGLLLFALLACDTLMVLPHPLHAVCRPREGLTWKATHSSSPPCSTRAPCSPSRPWAAGQREGRHRQPRRRGHDAVRRHRRLRHRGAHGQRLARLPGGHGRGRAAGRGLRAAGDLDEHQPVRHRPGPEPVRRRLLRFRRHRVRAGETARAAALLAAAAGRHPGAGPRAVPPAPHGVPGDRPRGLAGVVPVPLALRPGAALGGRVARGGARAGLSGAPHPPAGGGGRRRLCGLAGAYISVIYTPLWVEGMVAGKGWIALALTTFATWRPARVLLGAYLFGGVTMLQFHLQGTGVEVASEFLNMLPYLATIVVLALISRNPAWIRVNMPASLGKPFYPGT